MIYKVLSVLHIFKRLFHSCMYVSHLNLKGIKICQFESSFTLVRRYCEGLGVEMGEISTKL